MPHHYGAQVIETQLSLFFAYTGVKSVSSAVKLEQAGGVGGEFAQISGV